MIQIEDFDLPITAAEKLVRGTKKYDPAPLTKAVVKALTGNETEAGEQDMFSVEELKEIADYLMVYCNAHLEGD